MKTSKIATITLIILIGAVGIGLVTKSLNSSEGKNFQRNLDKSQQHSEAGTYSNSSENTRLEKRNCLADECLIVDDTSASTEDLPDTVKEALGKAIDDEYKALTTYQVIMDEFGRQRPFSIIARSEQMHIALLQSVYDKYNLKVPENQYSGTIPAPDSIQAACTAGVEAEIENAFLYEEQLLPAVQEEYPDIQRAFERLMNASQERHLPAFQRCS
jgi:hypothetical protein